MILSENLVAIKNGVSCGLLLLAGAFSLWGGGDSPYASKVDEVTQEFSPLFFPKLEERSREDVYLQGVIRLYPGRLLDVEPESLKPLERREPLSLELPGSVSYVRVYDLEAALPELRKSLDKPALIWDLRYLPTPATREAVAGLTREVSLRNGKGGSAMPAGETGLGIKEARVGMGPVIVLINERTRGGVEAALDSLQKSGAIMTVGRPTAGMTAVYEPLKGHDGYWVVRDELMSSGGESLLGRGMYPESLVEVTPEADFLGYQLIESGQSAESILRMSLPVTKRSPGEETQGEPKRAMEQRPADPLLQRAVEIVVALRVLGRLPSP